MTLSGERVILSSGERLGPRPVSAEHGGLTARPAARFSSVCAHSQCLSRSPLVSCSELPTVHADARLGAALPAGPWWPSPVRSRPGLAQKFLNKPGFHLTLSQSDGGLLSANPACPASLPAGQRPAGPSRVTFPLPSGVWCPGPNPQRGLHSPRVTPRAPCHFLGPVHLPPVQPVHRVGTPPGGF